MESTLPFELFVGGSQITDRYTASSRAIAVQKEIKLLAGSYLVMLKPLAVDTLTSPSTLSLVVKPSSEFSVDDVAPPHRRFLRNKNSLRIVQALIFIKTTVYLTCFGQVNF
ncbi:MAG: hypothetical protein RBR30_00185 [Tenuifilaceae bacterium]|nr:hypothetical protein [Tenuifilaceae bacterium]